MTAQERFDRALVAMASAGDEPEPEYEIDPKADKLRIAADGDLYSWAELPEHVRDHWRSVAEETS